MGANERSELRRMSSACTPHKTERRRRFRRAHPITRRFLRRFSAHRELGANLVVRHEQTPFARFDQAEFRQGFHVAVHALHVALEQSRQGTKGERPFRLQHPQKLEARGCERAGHVRKPFEGHELTLVAATFPRPAERLQPLVEALYFYRHHSFHVLPSSRITSALKSASSL